MPRAPTHLKKSRNEARRSLQERLDVAAGMVDEIRSREGLQKAIASEKLWREYNVQLLEALFTTPKFAGEYRDSVLSLQTVMDRYFDSNTFETVKSRFVASTTNQIGKLQSILNRLELVEDESAAPRSEQPPDKTGWLVTWAERFHLIALQMRKRYNGRPGFELNDEYDVQDLFHALLTISFNNIRREEPTPAYAGGAARMDFLLPELEAVVELKMMRSSLSTNPLGEQLIVDKEKYRKHPNCRTLYCVVYDPNGLIDNARGVEDDLSGQHGDLVVRVIIVPRGT